MPHPTVGVKGAARTPGVGTLKIPFPFRAYPTALDGMPLTRTARDVFALILDNAKSRGWRCRLSNATMARILGCCPMTIGRALVALESAGLILRELSHGGHVRTGILVTWDGVQHSCGTEQACVQQPCGTGSTLAPQGVQHSCGTNQSLPQSERSDGTSSLVGREEDPALRVAEGPEAAAYLRMLIAKGRMKAQESNPEPIPDPPPPSPLPVPEPIPPAPEPPTPEPIPPTPRQDDARRTVDSMVGTLAAKFTADLQRPRRVSPRKLERQLAELRRRHGGGRSR